MVQMEVGNDHRINDCVKIAFGGEVFEVWEASLILMTATNILFSASPIKM